MIDHITIEVSDLAKSKLFYEQAFAPLGYSVAFGKVSIFWAFVCRPASPEYRRILNVAGR